MAIATGAAISAEAIKERFAPVVERFGERVRKGRKAFVRGQHAAEDVTALAALGIRRRPVMSVMAAVAIGTLAGALAGFAIGRCTRRRE
jgi:ElaB/YqjD/DUF883 family membrane-anchored ribosome-binding protein